MSSPCRSVRLDRLFDLNQVGYPETEHHGALARLQPILEGLSEDRIRQLIDFARFLAVEQDRQEWLRFGQERLRPPDLRDFDVGPSWAFRAHRRSSRRVADWCRDRGIRPR